MISVNRKQAEEFFARNPEALQDMTKLRDAGLLDKLDCYYLLGKYGASKADSLVNVIRMFNDLG